MHSHWVKLLVAFCAMLFAIPLSAHAASEVLRVGVAYLPPVDVTPAARLYTEEGFELSIAGQLGKLTGRKVELVRIDDDELAQALGTGAVDVAVARITGEDTIPASVDAVPLSYASGLSVAMRSDTQVRSWADLRDKVVCVTQANVAGRRFVEELGARPSIERAPAPSLAKVRTGACDAAIHDTVLLQELFQADQWQKFSATLPEVLPGEIAVLFPKRSSVSLAQLRDATSKIADAGNWAEQRQRWATNVALEVYLDQDGPDCH